MRGARSQVMSASGRQGILRSVAVVVVLLGSLVSCGADDDGPGDSGSGSNGSVELERWRPAHAWQLERSDPEGRQLRISLAAVSCDEVQVRADETDDRVRVVVRARRDTACCQVRTLVWSEDVKLARPLGDRPVVDQEGRPARLCSVRFPPPAGQEQCGGEISDEVSESPKSGTAVVRPAPGSRRLTIALVLPTPCHSASVKAHESADRVRITVTRGEQPGRICAQMAVTALDSLELDEPLGDRTVVDNDGQALQIVPAPTRRPATRPSR